MKNTGQVIQIENVTLLAEEEHFGNLTFSAQNGLRFEPNAENFANKEGIISIPSSKLTSESCLMNTNLIWPKLRVILLFVPLIIFMVLFVLTTAFPPSGVLVDQAIEGIQTFSLISSLSWTFEGSKQDEGYIERWMASLGGHNTRPKMMLFLAFLFFILILINTFASFAFGYWLVILAVGSGINFIMIPLIETALLLSLVYYLVENQFSNSRFSSYISKKNIRLKYSLIILGIISTTLLTMLQFGILSKLGQQEFLFFSLSFYSPEHGFLNLLKLVGLLILGAIVFLILVEPHVRTLLIIKIDNLCITVNEKLLVKKKVLKDLQHEIVRLKRLNVEQLHKEPSDENS